MWFTLHEIYSRFEDYIFLILGESEPLSRRIPTECFIMQYVTFTLTYHLEFMYCIKQSRLKARKWLPIVCAVKGFVMTFSGVPKTWNSFLHGVDNSRFCILHRINAVVAAIVGCEIVIALVHFRIIWKTYVSKSGKKPIDILILRITISILKRIWYLMETAIWKLDKVAFKLVSSRIYFR